MKPSMVLVNAVRWYLAEPGPNRRQSRMPPLPSEKEIHEAVGVLLARIRKGSIGACVWHRHSPLGYMEWHENARARARRGEKQIRCPECRLYFWPDEYGTRPKDYPKRSRS